MLQGWIQIIVFCAVLIAIVPLLGGHMARVFTNERIHPLEGFFLRALRVDAKSMGWKTYAARAAETIRPARSAPLICGPPARSGRRAR